LLNQLLAFKSPIADFLATLVLFLQSSDHELIIVTLDMLQIILTSPEAVGSLCAIRRFPKALLELVDFQGMKLLA
jgi:hypothetical protein